MAAWIFGVMLFAFTAGVFVSVPQEMGGNPNIDEMGIAQDLGSMEGKEIRIGSAASAMWGMVDVYKRQILESPVIWPLGM